MVFRKAVAFLFILTLAACSYTPDIAELIDFRPGVKFSSFSQIPLNVSSVEFVVQDERPYNALNVSHLADVSIEKSVKNWVDRRLKPAGKEHKLLVRLAEARLVEKPMGHDETHLNIRGNQLEYQVSIEVQLEFQDDNGYFMNVTESKSVQKISLPEAVSHTRRGQQWIKLIQTAMREINFDLERRLYNMEPPVVTGINKKGN